MLVAIKSPLLAPVVVVTFACLQVGASMGSLLNSVGAADGGEVAPRCVRREEEFSCWETRPWGKYKRHRAPPSMCFFGGIVEVEKRWKDSAWLIGALRSRKGAGDLQRR